MPTAFITGASAGFGEATAKALAKKGFKLVLLGRRKQRLDELAKSLNVDVLTQKVDVRDKFQVFDCVKNLPENFKDIEILVNNAGLALGQDDFISANLDDFETMIDTNIKGFVYVLKAILPLMKARNSGYIFTLGSVAGQWTYAGSNIYGASKAFVKQLSLNLRNDLRGTNIRVTEIAPGLAKTEFSLVRFKGDEKKAQIPYENTQFLKAEDIAQIIVDCIHLPHRANVNSIEVMATTQTWAGFFFEKG